MPCRALRGPRRAYKPEARSVRGQKTLYLMTRKVRVKPARCGADQPQECVNGQLANVGEGEGGNPENGLGPEDQGEEGIGDHGRDDRRQQGLGLEVLAVNDLDGRKRPAQGRAENGAESTGGPCQKQDAPLPGRRAQPSRPARSRTPAPSREMGPSRPALPPAAMVRMDVPTFATGTEGEMCPS